MDSIGKILRAVAKKLGDCLIIRARCTMVCEGIRVATLMNFSKLVTLSDSQVVIKALNGNIDIPSLIISESFQKVNNFR